MGTPVQAGQAGRQGPAASGADDLHPNGTDTIVLIHGLWVTALIWEQWIARYRARGYRVLAPGWPGLDRGIAELRRDPSGIARLRVTDITAHYGHLIGGLSPPPAIGSFIAQEITLIRPDLVRRLILASSAPQGAAGMHGWAPEVIGAVGKAETSPEDYLSVFFAGSSSSRQAGQEVLQRIYARTQDRDKPTTWATREAQYDAVCAWGIPDHSLLQRLSGIDQPVFVANGDSDPMILPRYSHLIAGLIPQATVKIYPDSAHGFLFQHHAEFAPDVEAFLTKPD